MGEQVTLTAPDGHTLGAWRAGDGPGLVVIQEIFGANSHIRNTVDRFAEYGFTALAPALFDRLGPGLELGYEANDVARGRELRGQISDEQALADIAAAIALLAGEGRPVACVGYCWGGYLAWTAATQLDGLAAAVGYYGGGIAKIATATPACPVMLHFGEQDHAIPMSDVQTIIDAHPEIPVHVYPAGHGFSCDERGSYDQASHELALSRTIPFLQQHLGV